MLSSFEGLALFGFYAALIIILVWVTRGKNDLQDFLVMGRELGVLRGSLSIAVSWIWAPAVFICSLQAYSQGLPGIFWFTAPNILCFFVFVPIALRMRKVLPYGYTISQVFAHRFPGDARPHITALLVALGYQLGAIVINCVAGATLIQLLSGIPYLTGVLLMGALALSYSLISGLRASVLSDVAQMLMILVVALVLVPWTLSEAGGWNSIVEGLGGVSGQYRDLWNPEVAYSFGIATTIGLIAGPIADQMFAQRAYAAKERAILPIFVVGGLIFGVIPVALSLLGFVGAATSIGDAGFVVSDPQMIGPEVIAHYLPKAALMMFAVMAFAGLTSTLDSAFSAVGSLWAVDSRSYSMGAVREVSVSSARTGMVIFAIAGMTIAALRPQLLWVFLVYGALAASLVMPVILTLFWPRIRATAAFAGIAMGLTVGTPLSIYANVTGQTSLVVLAAVLGLALPGIVAITLSLSMRERVRS